MVWEDGLLERKDIYTSDFNSLITKHMERKLLLLHKCQNWNNFNLFLNND